MTNVGAISNKENRVRRGMYTIILGFSLGIFACYFSKYSNELLIKYMNVNSLRERNSADVRVFLSNVQTNVSEDDGGFFTPSPQVEESIIENDFQDI